MSELNVLFVDPKGATDLEWIERLPAAQGLRLSAPADGATETLYPLLAEADVLVAQSRAVDASILAQSPRLKLIQRYGSRPDEIDLAAAQEAGVAVATMPLQGCIAVAELAMTLILALSKKLVRAHQETVAGAYRTRGVEPFKTEQRKHNFQWMKLPGLFELNGRTLGIIGFGEIGTETARRACAFGMRILYNKRSRLPAAIEQAEGVAYAEKDDLLAESDFVLLSTPLTPDTERMIDAGALARMKPSAFLVNICRGGVIDEEALVEALRAGQIAGAGLDVFVYEPIPFDHPLLQLENVILTPHIGGGMGGARDRQMDDVLANVQRFARGEPLHYQVL